MKKIIALFSSLMLTIGALAQVTPTSTTLLSNPNDGTITVRSVGSGRTKAVAKEMAAKNAVRDIVFKGINVPGNDVRLAKPLVLDMNGQTKYEEFFDAFFADGGVYTQFISKQDRKWGSNVIDKKKNEVTVQVTVRVLRADLKKYLKENYVIK